MFRVGNGAAAGAGAAAPVTKPMAANLNRLLDKPDVTMFNISAVQPRRSDRLAVVYGNKHGVMVAVLRHISEGTLDIVRQALAHHAQKAADLSGNVLEWIKAHCSTPDVLFREHRCLMFFNKHVYAMTWTGTGTDAQLFYSDGVEDLGKRPSWEGVVRATGWRPDTTLRVTVDFETREPMSFVVGDEPRRDSRPSAVKVGEGAYGCVYRPHVPCPKPRTAGHGLLVSKFVAGHDELRTNILVKNLDPKGAFTIRMVQYCGADRARLRACHVLFKGTASSRKPVYNLVLPDGGKTLTEVMATAKVEHFPVILRGLRNVLQGLVVFARAGFVHNDVKATNIMIPRDKAKLVDFGISYEIARGGYAMRRSKFFNTWPPHKRNAPFYHAWPPELVCQAALRPAHGKSQKATLEDVLKRYRTDAAKRLLTVPWDKDDDPRVVYLLGKDFNRRAAAVDQMSTVWAEKTDTFSMGMVLWHLHHTMGSKIGVGRLRDAASKRYLTLHDALGTVAKKMAEPYWRDRVRATEALRLYDSLLMPHIAE